MNYEMIKYNTVVCWYGKMLVNVAAYVIPGRMYVVYRSVTPLTDTPTSELIQY